MREWWMFPFHQDEAVFAWGRRRAERPTSPASNLVALPLLLLVLGIPSHHREGYLWLCAAGTVSEYLQENSTRGGGGSGLERYASPATAGVRHRLPLPWTSKQVQNKVPLKNSDYHNNMQEIFKGTTPGAEGGRTVGSLRRAIRRKPRRRRRGIVAPDVLGFTPTHLISQPSPTEQSELRPSSGSPFTPVPDDASTASARFGFDWGTNSGTSYARTSSNLQSTPSVRESEATTYRRLTGFAGPTTPPNPPLSATSTVASSRLPSTLIPPHGSTLPNPPPSSAQDDPSTRVTASLESTGRTTLIPTRYDFTVPASDPSSPGHSPTIADGLTRAETDAVVTPGDSAAETRQASPASREPYTGAVWNSTSAGSTSRASTGLPGPPKVHAEGESAGQSSVYTIISEIRTEPSILIIMPCLVGLALLGLVTAGIKRCMLHWRLAHMVELSRDPEKLKEDKGYTIENPMVKSRRSYIERQMERTLQRVNKTDSSSSSSSNTSSRATNHSRNTTNGRNINNKKDTKVRMEIAAISYGSLRRPVRPLRRSASERVAPSHRRWSSLGVGHALARSSQSQTGCQCCCHCPLCGSKGHPLRNGSLPVENETTTTRL